MHHTFNFPLNDLGFLPTPQHLAKDPPKNAPPCIELMSFASITVILSKSCVSNSQLSSNYATNSTFFNT